MIKRIIITMFIFVIIVLLFVFTKSNKQVLVCNGDVVLIGSQANQEYTFEGANGYVQKEMLEVRLFTKDSSIAGEYYDIINSNSECDDIITGEDFISYRCHYDLVRDHYYEDLEDEDHRLSFEVIKSKFEEDNFVCTYE